MRAIRFGSVKSIALTLLCLFFIIYPLFAGPGPVNTRGGGDSPFLLVRLEQLVAGLQAGHFPVRWMPDAAYGLGYPFFNFYAALPYYLAALLRMLGWGPILSIQIVQALGFVLAALSMTLLARRLLSHPAAVALAAVSYTCAPFHLVNVYVRGDSLSEFYAFIWYPLIFWALLRLRNDLKWANVSLLALSYGGLLLTHNLSALMFTPFVAAYALFLIVTRKNRHADESPASAITWPQIRHWLKSRARPVGMMLCGGLLGLAISATLWLTAFVDLDAVRMSRQDIQTQGYFNYEGHLRGLDLVQTGFFFDYDVAPGTTPFAIGGVQSVLLLCAWAVWIVLFLLNRGRSNVLRLQIPVWCTGQFLSTLLVTRFSLSLWEALPLDIVQFPWRFLSIRAFFGSMVFGAVVQMIAHGRDPQPRSRNFPIAHAVPWLIALSASVLLVASSVGALRPEYLPINESDVTADRLALFERFTTNIGTTIRGEYLPVAIEPRPFTSLGQNKTPVVISGEVDHVEFVEHDTAGTRWRVEVHSVQARLVFYTYDFPGWTARIDGKPAVIETVPNSGLISLIVPHGQHTIDLAFRRTPMRWLADLITMLGFVIGIVLLSQESRPARTGFDWSQARPFLISVVALFVILTLLGRLFASRVVPPEVETLSMDFDRMPMLHANPQGIDFGPARLERYAYAADVVGGGVALPITLHWADLEPTWTVELALVSPALGAYPSFAPVPAPLARATSAIDRPEMTLNLAVPQDAASDLYYLTLRVHDAAGQEVRALTMQGHILGITYLRPLLVDNPRPEQASAPIRARFGDLIGGQIVLRDDVQVEVADDAWQVRLTWQALTPLVTNYTCSVRLLRSDGTPIPGAQRDLEGGPGYGFLPTVSWPVGEWITDRLRVPIPEGVAAGEAAAIAIVLYDRSLPDFPSAGSAVIPLVEREHIYQPPTMQHTVHAILGDQVSLLGYTLDKDQAALRLTLVWQSVSRAQADYTVFVHLYDPYSQEILVQADAQPLNGAYPTTWWLEGEIIEDTLTLFLSDLPDGEYALAVGLYDARDWTRLPVRTAAGEILPDGRLVLEHPFPIE